MELIKQDEFTFRIPVNREKGMRVPGIIYSTDVMMETLKNDPSLEQVVNVASMPGIVKASIAMPDIHLGYGFPIGGVAAFDYERGVVSPGGVGYDINCGVSLMKADLKYDEIAGKLSNIVEGLFHAVPSGMGSNSRVPVTSGDMDEILQSGIRWALDNGYATKEDSDSTEENGTMSGVNTDDISREAKARGMKQIGTLGAGNHFLEVQKVSRIFNPEIASAFGISLPDQIVVMVHTGSRGLGHQVATDYMKRLNEDIPGKVASPNDRQLISAEINSRIGGEYISAMKGAANFAFVNRQIILSRVREVFSKVLGRSEEELSMKMVYGLAHNIAKVERHNVNGEIMNLMVHRKGATRAFPAGNSAAGPKFMKTGHPVLVPGDMGSASYVMVGAEKSMDASFGSSCHGAGRLLSRQKSLKNFDDAYVERRLKEAGVLVKSASRKVLIEEAPGSYKNIEDVISAVVGAGLATRVAKNVPVGVVKG
ncbi:MAG: RNA-splicing ligase RtcB [Thermoplasmatales archaeon B_DKE]|nr:MAG: RNA-splicing ligase RtcB [Thermoplasmatales archaeon B_DKE]